VLSGGANVLLLNPVMIDRLWHSTPPPPHLPIKLSSKTSLSLYGLLSDEETRTLAKSKELEMAHRGLDVSNAFIACR
jgi:hypothetical protein